VKRAARRDLKVRAQLALASLIGFVLVNVSGKKGVENLVC
jgi:hypothetical protein